MKKNWIHSVFPFILLLLSACSGKPSTPIVSPPDIPSTDKFVPTDPSVPLEVSTGKEFYIAVPSNPSTGYHWEVMNKWNEKVMTLHATEYQSTSAESMPGSGGLDVWRFDAIGPGDVQFVITYFPPGNNDTAEQTLTFAIKVK